MDLPSFLWLWRIAAWSMGLSLTAYVLLGMTGGWMFATRTQKKPRPKGLRLAHLIVGGTLVTLVLLLLTIGIVGTLGYYGNLGHSAHLPAGLLVVALVLVSAVSGLRIHAKRPDMRGLHIATNLLLFAAFAAVSWTGWSVVQKYLP
ncbi:DUF4079 domain-containing protein [Baaleninema sp.]|uniref:DUF4079 domain-containing protein n=1 Tax=Baaleninema sp. TaxID=3101197 RepID=UPI003D08A148